MRALQSETDRIEVVGSELHWLCRTARSQSGVTGARIEKAVGGPATIRNMNTIDRIVAKYG